VAGGEDVKAVHGEEGATTWLKRLRLPIESGNYPYVTARVRGKKSHLFPKEIYNRMLKMSVPEISRILGEGDYKEEILELGAKYSGVDLIEMATRNNLAKVYTQIIEFSEGELRRMISHFADRWDMANLKTILRGKLYGASEEEIWEDVIPAGSMTTAFLRELVAKESVPEIVGAIRETIYYEPLKALAEEGAEVESLAAYEDALSHVYYADLLESIPPTTEAKQLFRTFVQRGIDVLNLKNLLRLRLEGGEIDRPIFISGGYHLSVGQLESMVEMDDESLLQGLRRTPYQSLIGPLLPEAKTEGLRAISRALEIFDRTQAAKYAHTRPLSVLPVLDYMLAKETEVDNLRIIARGKEAGLAEDLIRQMLVT
jgi:V/A-type H+-transporting ATPase subunit C